MSSGVVAAREPQESIRDAERWLKAELREDTVPPLLLVIGLGDGHLLDALERLAPATRVLALEPDALATRAFFARRNWNAWRDSGRLVYLTGPDYEGANDAWRLLSGDRGQHKILVSPAIGRDGDGAVRAARVLKRIVFAARANAEARRAFSGRYLINTLDNLPALVKAGDVTSLANVFAGVPVFVVAAGPSLDENLPRLKDFEDEALIIAVDTAFRPLCAAGIQPHLIVAVDPSELNAKHLLGVAGSGHSWLACEGSVDPRVLAAFECRLFAFRISDHHPWPRLNTHRFDKGSLRAWGSVLTTAFDLACHAGCDPIVFVGADLAHTGGLHYCRNTIHEPEAHRHTSATARREVFSAALRLSKRATCQEADLRGAPVVTAPHFVQFRDWLVSRSSVVAPRRVLNATGNGILHGPAITQINLGDLNLESSIAGREIHARLAVAAAPKRPDQDWRDVTRSLKGAPVAEWSGFTGGAFSPEHIKRRIEIVLGTAPRVTLEPTGVSRIPGWTAGLAAAADGGPAPTVQWQVSTDEGASWRDIAGATMPTYTFRMAATDEAKEFRATFGNAHGLATTRAARVSLAAPGPVSDFNGDGRSDLVLRHRVSGMNSVWYLDGLKRIGSDLLETQADLTWRIVGIGDFDGDGKPDILWRNSVSGLNLVWFMEGVTRTRMDWVESESDLAWSIVGIADFNCDGKPDILWHNRKTGASRVWFMDGITRSGSTAVEAEADLDWTIAATGDVDGNGRPDILWRHEVTGANRVWLMDGIRRTGVESIAPETDRNWRIVATGDFHGDGKLGILWTNPVSGANRIWHMDGPRLNDVVVLPSITELNWRPVPHSGVHEDASE